jgi:hypothetical protein
MENWVRLLDLSHYDEIVKFPLIREAGFPAVILKCGGSDDGLYDDRRFAERVQQAYDERLLIGAYYFAGTKYWLQKQYTMSMVERLRDEEHPILQHVLKLLRNKAVHFLAFDFEDASENAQTSPPWHTFFLRDMVERLRRQIALGNLRPLKLGVYSRRSWIDSKAKDLDVWLGTQPDLFIWCANWAGGTSRTLLLKEIAQQMPLSGHQPRSFGWSAARSKTWHFWQWTGDSGYGFKCKDAILTAAGLPRPVDMNFFNGTLEELRQWLGIAAPAPPAPTNPEPVPPASKEWAEINGKLDQILEQLRKLEWLGRP